MKIVIQRFIAKIILTTDDGSQSKTIVLNSTRVRNIAIKAAIAKRIPVIPETIEPVLSD